MLKVSAFKGRKPDKFNTMESYLDFGSDSDSDEPMHCTELDSDEEEARDNEKLFKILIESKPQSKRSRDVDDFEMEMEAELDKRALEVEARGGLEHQKSLSRSSSTSSLNKKSPCPSPKLAKRSAISVGPSHSQPKKSVKFSLTDTASSSKPCDNQAVENKTSVETTPPSNNSGGEESLKKDEKKKPETYDDIYFDSDESDGEDEQSRKKKKDKKAFLSNDDLFYDPESDSRDQEWVNRHRRKYCKSPNKDQTSASAAANGSASSTSSSSIPQGVQPLPSSDAVLNCPACFTVLCLDCQQHDLYAGQYRAMFVMNCAIITNETIQVPLKETKRFKRNNRGDKKVNVSDTDGNANDSVTSIPGNLSANDSFNPVKCKICRTQIAVYDSDEVYHFYNVLASAP